jgi:shikimate kinase
MARRDSVWLVGLSAAGKSTVGSLVAEALGYEFADLDALIEASVGMTVAEIFRTAGEQAFRNAEARVSDELLARRCVVVATGAGWMARADIPRGRPGCVRVWLRVSPVAAFERLARELDTRPLLAGGDGEGVLADLLALREKAYAEAELSVDTTGLEPAEVASLVMERLQDVRD